MNVGRKEDCVAAAVSNGANASYEIADDPSSGTAIGGAGIIARATEPGEIALFFYFLFESKIALRGGGFLVLLVVLRSGIVLLPLLAILPQERRAIFGEQNRDAVCDS